MMKVYSVHEVLSETQRKLAETRAERDALAAQVEDMRDELAGLASVVYKTSKSLIEATETLENELLPALEDKEPLIELIEEFKAVIAATPQQCLAEIRVQAVEWALKKLQAEYAQYPLLNYTAFAITQHIEAQTKSYAATVRQGGAE